jgi:hypothetical protein
MAQHPRTVENALWTIENAMKINPGTSKTVSFTRVWEENSLNYFLGDQRIPEVSNCKYLGKIISNYLIWVDQVNCTVRKAWKALHFIMRILQKGK